jgi:hypothetical protein
MAATSLGLNGHTYLPYPQAACCEIEHQLLSLSTAFPSAFEATLSPFTHDDGRNVVLVHAAGALPATGAEVSMWLVEAYPHVAPLVFFVSPSAGPGTTKRASYVDGCGAVTAPYLQHYRWPDSDLVGLVQSLDVLVRLHDDQPLAPEELRQAAVEEVATDPAACTIRDDGRRLDGDTDTQRALRAVQDEKSRLEHELQRVSNREAELLDAVLAERRAVEREAAEDALDRALQEGCLPLRR